MDELHPERDTGSTPIFQVMFNLHNEPALTLDLDDLEVTPFGIDRGTAKFDLSVGLTESKQGLFASYEYNADLFDEQTIIALASSYEAVLDAVVASAECRLSELPLAVGRASAESPVVRQVADFVNDWDAGARNGSLVGRFNAQGAP